MLRIILFVYFVETKGEAYSADSYLYLHLADNICKHLVFSRDTLPPFTPEVFRTPGYPVFLAILKLLGVPGPYGTAAVQEIIYLACVMSFLRYGRIVFAQKIVWAATIFLLLEPGGLAYPKEIFAEVLFLPGLLGGLLAIAYYLRQQQLRYLLLAACLMGIGALVRPVIFYLPLLIAVVLLAFAASERKRWVHVGLFLLTFVLVISPWLGRNYYYFNKVVMSGQQSNMFAYYHVPLVLQAAEGKTFKQGRDFMLEQVARAEKQQAKVLDRPLNFVEKFKLEQQLAFAELAKYPQQYAKQWLYGIIKTMVSANLLELNHVLRLPIESLSFYAGESQGFTGRVVSFMQNPNRLYVALVCFRLLVAGFAVLGMIKILKGRDCFLWIMLLANLYFIGTPGPMGYARFRFPMEVFWFIQALLGWQWLMGMFGHGKQRAVATWVFLTKSMKS